MVLEAYTTWWVTVSQRSSSLRTRKAALSLKLWKAAIESVPLLSSTLEMEIYPWRWRLVSFSKFISLWYGMVGEGYVTYFTRHEKILIVFDAFKPIPENEEPGLQKDDTAQVQSWEENSVSEDDYLGDALFDIADEDEQPATRQAVEVFCVADDDEKSIRSEDQTVLYDTGGAIAIVKVVTFVRMASWMWMMMCMTMMRWPRLIRLKGRLLRTTTSLITHSIRFWNKT